MGRGDALPNDGSLNAIADDLEAQPPNWVRHERVETIYSFVSNLPDVQASAELQNVVDEWRNQLLGVIERTDIQAIVRKGCDHRLQFADETISLTAMGKLWRLPCINGLWVSKVTALQSKVATPRKQLMSVATPTLRRYALKEMKSTCIKLCSL